MGIKLKPIREKVAALDRKVLAQYEQYFTLIAPKTVEDVFQRWMFAYASVHTGWEANCALYGGLKSMNWIGDATILKQIIVDSKAGLHNNRTKYIMEFTEFFWRNPAWFNKLPDESWYGYRDRIMTRSPGVGRAKAAFLLELTCFHKADLACFDTHLVQAYGFTPAQYSNGKVKKTEFDKMEKNWTNLCKRNKVSPVTARWLLWDLKVMKGEQPSPRYWSAVLEHPDQTAECEAIFKT